MKLAFVVQRYGLEATGGAERHCRALALRLARHHSVEILTTCARDYAEWRNHYPPGRTGIEGIAVHRHPVERPRSAREFALWSDIVFRDHHTAEDEREWVRQNGPYAPSLVEAVAARSDVDLFLFYSYRYYPACFGLPRVADRAVLVPTAEDDDAVRLPLFRDLFRAARAFLFLTLEEKELVEGAAGITDRPCAVVGSGIDVDPGWEAVDVGARFDLAGPYLLYVGRLDPAKGVDRLIASYTKMAAGRDLPPLVLAGPPVMEIAPHPGLRVLGVVTEAEKFALLARAEVVLMPSALESLSLLVLEAWAMGRPVLANAECKVLEGQCRRANGGLYYRGHAEFAPALARLLDDAEMRAALGRCGRAYVQSEYDWSVVEGRTRALLEGLERRG